MNTKKPCPYCDHEMALVMRSIDAIKAYRELTVVYRIGRQPSERLFSALARADEFLKELEKLEQS